MRNRPLTRTCLETERCSSWQKRWAESWGSRCIPSVVRGGSDGNFTASTGCPTLDGMGTTGGHVHQLGEYINLSHLAFRSAFTAEMALRVLESN